MTAARTGELPAETVILEWEPTGDSSQSFYAEEMVAALYGLTSGWLEPLAVEVAMGCYDRELLAEGVVQLPQAFHCIVKRERPTVRIDTSHHSTEQQDDVLARENVVAWIRELLGQSCGGARYETSLRRMHVRASSIKLPPGTPGTATPGSMLLEYNLGRSEIPIDNHIDGGWISGPPAHTEAPQPVLIELTNLDGWLRLTIKVYWSPWLDELTSSGMIHEGVEHLHARGWRVSDG